jgi:hypothetical protein
MVFKTVVPLHDQLAKRHSFGHLEAMRTQPRAIPRTPATLNFRGAFDYVGLYRVEGVGRVGETAGREKLFCLY